MMEVSSRVKTEEEEEEDENELSLELSIGRKCYDKKTSSTPMLPPKSIHEEESNSKMMITSTSSISIQAAASRRQEKRDEKRDVKSTLSCTGGDADVCCVINHVDHHHHVLVDDQEEDEMPPRKKEKCVSFSFNNTTSHHNNVVSNVGPKKQEKLLLVRDLNLKPGLMGESPCPYPTLPAMQYVPFTNGFVYNPMPSSLANSVVACTNNGLMDKRVSFASATAGFENNNKRVSFRPYSSSSSRNIEMMSVVNGSRSDASSGATSPAVSDHHNSSLQGGSSSISFPQETQNASSAGSGPKRSEIKSWDSMRLGSNEVKVRTKSNHIVNTTSLTNIQVGESRCSEETKPAATLEDPTLGTNNPIDPALLKKKTSNVAVITNPPKTQLECNGASSLPQMPCVSTTVNGPNGKTITGFLYRYTKTEVCIVCVCHGTSFSPAEFVKHAGGVDVEHPLRHITTVPSDLT